MSSQNSAHLDKLLMRRKIADHMFLMAIPYYTKVRRPIRPFWTESEEKLMGLKECEKRADEYFCTIAYLVAMGCDHRSLHVVLDLAAAINEKDGRRSVPKANTVKSLAKRMKRLAGDIKAAECTHFLTVLNQQEAAKWRSETGLGSEDIEDLSQTFPFMAIPKWLEKRASMYDEWSRLASQGLAFDRLGRACVAMYVKYATGKTFFPEVLKLLELRNFGRFTATQLSRETKEFETGYPWSCGYLETQFHVLHRPGLTPSRKHIIGGISEEVLKSSKLIKYCVPLGDSVYLVKPAVPTIEEPKDHATDRRRGTHHRVPKKRRR